MPTKRFEPLQIQRVRFGPCKTSLSPQVSIIDHSKVVLLLWFLSVTCCYARVIWSIVAANSVSSFVLFCNLK